MTDLTQKYLTRDYLDKNPTWDVEDSPWKARHVMDLLAKCKEEPTTICEIGCGAGGILNALSRSLPNARLYGFDIAPDVILFWERFKTPQIEFTLGDFLEINARTYDVILLLDLIEHLQDPFHFLHRVSNSTKYIICHIPLDLSAISVLREKPLLHVREKVGHIHYYTKNIAIALLEGCGYRIVHWAYTGAGFTAPQRSISTKMAGAFRKAVFSLNRDWGARLLGGETLMVLAEPRSDP